MSEMLIVSRALDADVASRRIEDQIVALAVAGGAQVLVVPHIYHLADGSALWDEAQALAGRVAVAAWMSPRPAEWTLRSHGLAADELLAVDLRECESAEMCWAAIAQWLMPGGAEGGAREVAEAVEERWYPVADYSRCIGCGHCMQFCIFGVWAEDDGRVVAVAPDNCKAGCPACARICPKGAIIFPMCDEPAIAGVPGTIMEPDDEARHMYTERVGVPHGVQETSPVHDEIDSLIDELDDMLGSGE